MLSAATSHALLSVPPSLVDLLRKEHLAMVAIEPATAQGVFSVYYVGTAPYRVLHISFRNWQFNAASWTTSTVDPATLSALTFSFLVRAGEPHGDARRTAETLLSRAGIPFTFAMLQ